MSFSTEVKSELNGLHLKGNCCKKAYVLGALLSADHSDDATVNVKITDDSTSQKLISLLGTLYKITPEIRTINRGCFRSTELTFKSHSICDFLNSCDKLNDDGQVELLEKTLRCNNCCSAFIGAVLCSCGTVSDPKKSYTLEFRCPNEKRARMICHAISKFGLSTPCLTQRRGAVGLFYRNENAIEDVLTACGASNALFTFFDVAVEKDLRNKENRATNCVAKNISKSVNAATMQILSIEALIAADLFDDLPDELKRTAKLRLENSDVSLMELVELHVPKISKSGLNHRLSKLIDIAKNNGLV